VLVVRQLREAGLDHRQPGAHTGGLERELDVGAARVGLRQPVDVPGEPEHRRLLDPFDPHAGRIAAVPGHRRGATRPQVDARLVAEPRTKAFCRGQRGPHLLARLLQLDHALDPIRERHDNLLV